MNQFTGFLGPAYLWVKAAHLTFVIFWLAGLFLLPRFYVYHQETTVGSPEDRAWIEREARVRSIILTPAMLVVWILGLMLAFDNSGGCWDQGGSLPSLRWWSRSVAIRGGSAITARSSPTASGHCPGRTVRMINEIPGIAAALIVVLVIVRPF